MVCEYVFPDVFFFGGGGLPTSVKIIEICFFWFSTFSAISSTRPDLKGPSRTKNMARDNVSKRDFSRIYAIFMALSKLNFLLQGFWMQ